MGRHVVEDGKERLLLVRAMAPVCCSAALVPGFLDKPGLGARVVIRLNIVRGVVACRAKEGRPRLDRLWNGKVTAHLMGPHGLRVEPGDKTGARRRAHGSCGKCVRVAHALLGQPINMGRVRVIVSPTAKRGAHVFDRDPEDIGTVCRGCRQRQA